MSFSFRQPLALLLIPLAIIFSVYVYKRHTAIDNARKITILFLRSFLLAALVLAFAGTGIRHVSGTVTTVFVVDGSESMAASMKESCEEFLKGALKEKNPREKAGIVHFGLTAEVELAPSREPVFSSILTQTDGRFTNMEKGLELASFLLPSEDRKRLVLMSDGGENTGDALRRVKILRQHDITVDVYPLFREKSDEVQLTAVNSPRNLHLNEAYEITADIYSNCSTEAVVRLYTGRSVTAERKVRLEPGDNRYVFSCTALEGGTVTHQVEVISSRDTVLQNNNMSVFAYVHDIPSILVVHGKDRDGSELVKMLEGDLDVQECFAQSVPLSLAGMQKYDAFILANVPAESLEQEFQDNLEAVVRLQGKGLLVTGGEDSYAPGGYSGTVLEDILPVEMDVKQTEEEPDLGLVLVIDKSGSMGSGSYGVSKMELAKEAAIRSCEVLGEEDMIGVIAFDSAAKWAVEFQEASSKEKIERLIGTIRAGGGTQIIPPLKQAHLVLKDADTKLKHIILLTDGQAEKAGYDELLDDITDAGITLSTVAVGSSADKEILEALAWFGGGRFYSTDEFTDIPKIFAKETFMAGKKFLNNRRFYPALQSYSEMLQGIEAIPYLDGYVATTAKNASRVVLSTDIDEPLLATWQYGLGNTVAWTSDTRGMWSSSWMLWENSPRFWKNVVSWILQYHDDSDYTLEGRLEDGKGVLTLELPPGDDFRGEVKASITGPEGGEDVVMVAERPGLFGTEFTAAGPGVYIAKVVMAGDDGTAKTISGGVNIPYSPEYDTRRDGDESFMAGLATAGGGRVIRNANEVFSGELDEAKGTTDLTPYLLLIAAVLFLLEVVFKRIKFPVGKILAGISTLAQRIMSVLLRLKTRHGKVNVADSKIQHDGHAGMEETESMQHSGGTDGSKEDEKRDEEGKNGSEKEKKNGINSTWAGNDGKKNVNGTEIGSGGEKCTDRPVTGSVEVLLEKKRRKWMP